MRLRPYLLPLLAALWLTGCSLLPDQIDETKDWSASTFYAEAKEAMNSGDYERAIRYFEGLQARYPLGAFAIQAQLEIGYAYYKDGEPESALAAFDRFIKLHPQNPHVDYAYYMKGIVNFNRGSDTLDRYLPTDLSQRDPGSALASFKDFSELIHRFPDSKYSADARKRLVYLRNNLARLELHVARFYVRKGAYLAAANRAKYVIENYPRSTSVREALEIQIACYQRLGLDTLAQDARRVLELNLGKGLLVDDRREAESVSVGQNIWELLGLDEN